MFSIVHIEGTDYVASAGGDRLIRLWDLKTRYEVGVLVGHILPILTLAYSNKSQILFSSG